MIACLAMFAKLNLFAKLRVVPQCIKGAGKEIMITLHLFSVSRHVCTVNTKFSTYIDRMMKS